EEFQAELTEFRDEVGIDLLAEVAANLTGEMVLGLSGRGPGWLVVTRLADPERFASCVGRLSEHYQLAWESSQAGAYTIRAARSPNSSLAYALVGNDLIIAGQAQTLRRLLADRLAGASLAARADVATLLRVLPAENRALAYFEPAWLVGLLERYMPPGIAAAFRRLADLTDGSGPWALTIASQPEGVTIDWAVGSVGGSAGRAGQ
ncbi:MAG: hypothetical protein ACE5K7_06285, partial [Phycisphaerae bacterium]